MTATVRADLARWCGGLLPLAFFVVSWLAVALGLADKINLKAADVVAAISFLIHVAILAQLAIAIFHAGRGRRDRRVAALTGPFLLSFVTLWGLLAFINDAFAPEHADKRVATLLLVYGIVLVPTLVIFLCCYGLGRISRGDNGGNRAAENGGIR
jgi:hypothetical protein